MLSKPLQMLRETGPTASPGEVRRLILAIGRGLSASLDLSLVQRLLMERAIEGVRAERGCLFLLDERGEPKLVSAPGQDFSFSLGLVCQALKMREPILSANEMVVPISYQDQVRGMIYVDKPRGDGFFCHQDLELLRVMAAQAAHIMENEISAGT